MQSKLIRHTKWQKDRHTWGIFLPQKGTIQYNHLVYSISTDASMMQNGSLLNQMYVCVTVCVTLLEIMAPNARGIANIKQIIFA